MSTVPKPVMLIADAVQAAHERFYEVAFSESELTAAEKSEVMRYVEDPLWRPLCEIAVNGITSFEGASLLLGAKMITTSAFRIRHGPDKGSITQCVELTDEGYKKFNYFYGSGIEVDLKEKAVISLMAYALIDNGAGAAASRCALEAAIENHDYDLLRRIRSVPFGAPQFMLAEGKRVMPDTTRLEYLGLIFDRSDERSGAGIIDLPASSSYAFVRTADLSGCNFEP